ncbi:hypothetical protein GGTG_08646 [Gaeumannomyces tritici R3-111a-1]|uniref:Uncharacterized protein n=1 Tax=Gaeumannomyces tritici (strain R3-111a-1) TaxID=644352 RepID=J3P560_GAET3|nr:hypothetical protein GGTG_08646 [Gaeumannomyces tritici R3-111a-1]EJT74808.1 hypothetical protein GGTG_08646 [Gaeumannomyces tritici R3-111a-1]
MYATGNDGAVAHWRDIAASVLQSYGMQDSVSQFVPKHPGLQLITTVTAE